ncbi:hypothetical protein ACRRTK_012889 [Alexandromys fortis]
MHHRVSRNPECADSASLNKKLAQESLISAPKWWFIIRPRCLPSSSAGPGDPNSSPHA